MQHRQAQAHERWAAPPRQVHYPDALTGRCVRRELLWASVSEWR